MDCRNLHDCYCYIGRTNRNILPMKPLLLTLLLSLSLAGFGQDLQIGGFDTDCGTWVKDTVTVSDWQTVDTTNYDPCASAEWVYTDWITPRSYATTLLYCPCGCGNPTVREKYRVNLQGIQQKQIERTTYRYIQKPKTEYEKVWDEIYKRTKEDADTLSIAPYRSLTSSGSTTLILTDTISNWGTLYAIPDPKYDTVAVWLTYADTTKSISYNMTVKGYEVTKTHYVPEVWKTEDHGNALVYYEAHWQTDHVAYLDHFKKPMNRLVWGTKRREK